MLQDQLAFIRETEKLKAVLRRSRPIGLERRENSAEHSWSLALMAMTLTPTLAPELELEKVIRLVVLHDLVEIDAGDTFCYGDQSGKLERETAAAKRIFGLLPEPLASDYLACWLEFEEVATPESRFANCLDRLHPLILNSNNHGGTWVEYGVRAEQVRGRMAVLKDHCPPLWQESERIIQDALERGWLT